MDKNIIKMINYWEIEILQPFWVKQEVITLLLIHTLTISVKEIPISTLILNIKINILNGITFIWLIRDSKREY